MKNLSTSAFVLALMFGCAVTAQGQYQWTNFAGLPGGQGNVDGTGNAARFDQPWGSAVDSSGNLYVADSSNHVIRKVTPAGVVTTLAGQVGVAGFTDGTGTGAQFSAPAGVTFDSAHNVFYVADRNNNAIRKITLSGVVTTLAGGSGGTGGSGSADGTGTAAQFFAPSSLAQDTSFNLYVTDSGNNTIRKVTSTGVVTTLAGSAGQTGTTDGSGTAARFSNPSGIAFDGSNTLYVCDTGNSTIRKATVFGAVTTFAGNPAFPSTLDGTGTAAHFKSPSGLTRSSTGVLYVTDPSDNVVRKITATGVVSTLAGSAGSSGSADGTGSAARFSSPYGASTDSSGNVYVSDYGNSTIRKVTSTGVVTTLAGEPSHDGSVDGTGTAARFAYPNSVAVDASGNVFVADTDNHTIRMITSAGVATTLAGSPGQNGSADGTGSAARFDTPTSVAVDAGGNVYVADSNNATVRKVTLAGVVTTMAGSPGSSGTADGTGSAARFSNPYGVAVDASGTVYVADQGNNTLRKVTAAGVVTTLAGSAGLSGSADGTGAAARFSTPSGVAVDGGGSVYVADSGNSTLRKVTPAGVVTTLAGSVGQFASVDGTGSAASFDTPLGVAVDGGGNVYVADNSDTIRKVTPAGVVTTIGGTAGVQGGADGSDAAAQFHFDGFGGVAVSSAGVIFVADASNNRISKGTYTGPSTAPIVATPTSASITATGATLGGNVTSDGGATVTERGVVYSVSTTNSSPTIGGSGVTKVTASGTTGVFTVSVSSLTAGTGYSYAAYATNSVGTSYTTPVSTFATLSNNADLSSLALSAGTLSPVFAAGTTAYTATVLKASAAITVTPTAAESHATLQVRVNGGSYASVASGSASGSLSLNLGDNPVDVLVTAQDGTTTKTYTTTVTRWTNLQNWRNQYFSTIANSGSAADTATPQNDGIADLMKFAMGLDPTKNVLVADSIAKSGNSLQFNYQRNIDAIGEVTFIVEWSDTLQSNDWHTTGVTESILSATSTLQQVQATVDVTGVTRRFMRLRVTDP